MSVTKNGGQRGGWPLDRRGTMLVFIAVVVPLLLFAISAIQQWNAAQNDVRLRVEHARDLFRAHTTRVLQTQLQLGRAVRASLGARQPDEVVDDPGFQEYLESLKSEFPEVRAIWLYDDKGEAVSSSLAFPAPSSNIGQRSFFHHLADDGAPYQISSPFARNAGQEKLFSIGMPIREFGDFAGAVVIDIDPDYFRSLQASVALPDGALGLARLDGTILARVPEEPDAPEKLKPDSPLLVAAASADEGTQEGTSSLDRRSRVFAYGKLGAFPAVIFYSAGTDAVSRQWRRRVVDQALYFLPATLILAMAAYFAARGQRKLEVAMGERALANDRLRQANAELTNLNATLEDRVARRTAALTNALEEKDVLIQEVHHRVKNNMQVINSLVGLQGRMGGTSEDTQRRVQAMSLVHELIHGTGALERLELTAHVRRLCDSLRSSTPAGVSFDCDLESATIALDKAVPFSLALSETLVNILRRGFGESETGKVQVQVRSTGDWIELSIIWPGSGDGSPPEGDAFSARLVSGLVAQLQGKMEQSGEPGARRIDIGFSGAAPSRVKIGDGPAKA